MAGLPESLDTLRGLRAARWIRESTERQTDRYGPDAQKEQQDRALERWQLVDSGLAWQVAHSGRTIATTVDLYSHVTPGLQARAAEQFDEGFGGSVPALYEGVPKG